MDVYFLAAAIIDFGKKLRGHAIIISAFDEVFGFRFFLNNLKIGFTQLSETYYYKMLYKDKID